MGDGRRPTLRDVAARAGVSFKTVSRVVNDEAGVSPVLDRAGPAGRRRARLPAERRRPRPAPRRRAHGVDRAAARRRRRPVLGDAPARGARTPPWPRGRGRALAPALDGDPERERSLVEAFAARARRRADPRPVGRRPVVPRRRGGLGDGGRLRRPRAAPPRRRRRRGDRRDRRGVGGPAPRGGTVTRGSRSSATGQRAARQRLAGYRAGLEAAGLVPDPALVVRRPRATPRSPTPRWAALFRTTDPPTALFTARDAVTVGGAARAAAGSGCSGSSRWSGSATSSSRTCSRPGSPSSPRTPPASADGPRTCCSRGWRARPGRPRPTRSRRC